MATLDQFLDKALKNEAVNKAFKDQMNRQGMGGKPGKYEIFLKVDFKMQADDMEDAMDKAEIIANEISRKYNKYKAHAEVDAVDSP